MIIGAAGRIIIVVYQSRHGSRKFLPRTLLIFRRFALLHPKKAHAKNTGVFMRSPKMNDILHEARRTSDRHRDDTLLFAGNFGAT